MENLKILKYKAAKEKTYLHFGKPNKLKILGREILFGEQLS